MRFLNQKEEMYDIQLTQYGKRLLAQGRFRPTYYAFFDEGVYYDELHAGVSSSQSASVDRIQEMPNLGATYIHKGVETTIKKLKKGFAVSEDESLYLLPLGSAKVGNQNRAAFNVKFLHGELSASVEYLSSSFCPGLAIPQLSSSVEYDMYIRTTDQVSSEELMTKQDIEQKVYEDGTYIHLDKDFLFLELDEKNCASGRENFEVEVYEIKTSTDGSEELFPLKFRQDDGENFDALDDYVEYYFDVNVDNEIAEQLYCKYENKIKTRSIFVSEEQDCRVEKKSEFAYRSPIDQNEDDC